MSTWTKVQQLSHAALQFTVVLQIMLLTQDNTQHKIYKTLSLKQEIKRNEFNQNLRVPTLVQNMPLGRSEG